jgi:hypothetical protein
MAQAHQFVGRLSARPECRSQPLPARVGRPDLSRPWMRPMRADLMAAHGGVGSSSPSPLSPEYRSIHSSRLNSLGMST